MYIYSMPVKAIYTYVHLSVSQQVNRTGMGHLHSISKYIEEVEHCFNSIEGKNHFKNDALDVIA